jgi:uncharacterized repeat protein (TIGR03803 family)
MKKLRTSLLALNLLAILLATPFAYGAIGAIKGTTFTTLVAFNNTNGANPYDPPVLGPDGNLYGTTFYGGTNGVGVIFKVTTNSQVTTLHIFNTGDGAYPSAPLAVGHDGNLYGVTDGGGTNNQGAIFEMTTNGTFILLYSFGMVTNGLGYALDGSYPYGGLIQGRDGNFYGTTYSGGITNEGTVFQFLTNGMLITLHSFTGTNGANPYTAPLVEGADGIFYGTTSAGGTNGDGTIFQITTNRALTTLFEFDNTNGLYPYAGLSFGPDGDLYGTTIEGGTNRCGTVFQITTNGNLTTLFQFDGTNGLYPEGGVVSDPNNVLYGTTYEGGAAGYGTVFQLTTNGLLTTLYSFTNGGDGANPYAGVIRDAGGVLYGAALDGSTNDDGTVYRWSDPTRPTNTITLPTANQRWSNVVFTVSGTAGDNVEVGNVFYSLNGAVWATASTANDWSNWTAGVMLTPGTNVIHAYAVDTSGNVSTTNQVSFDFVVTNQLQVRATGLGAILPNDSNAWLEVGRNYSIKATPATGFAATNWVISTNWSGGANTNNATVQFMMASNLTLQLNFAEVSRPMLTITAPTNLQKLTNALAHVKGTASDNWYVNQVWYQLNSGSWNPATTTNAWTNWTVTLPLVQGTNTVKAYAVDLGGNNSNTNSVSMVASNTFKLQFNFATTTPMAGNGLNFSLQVSPGINGTHQFCRD